MPFLDDEEFYGLGRKATPDPSTSVAAATFAQDDTAFFKGPVEQSEAESEHLGLSLSQTGFPKMRRMGGMSERSYFTYIVASRSHTLYIGVTGNLRKRVFEHKWREHEGFTEKYNCDRLVWFEVYGEVTKAIAREKQLKGWRRDRKIELIEAANPAWVDLGRDWYDLEPADMKRARD